MPTTIFTATLTGDDSFDSGKSYRTEIPITGASLGQVMVTFKAPAGGLMSCLHCSIGVSKKDGTWSTVATPVELLFSTASGFSIAANGTLKSDPANLAALSTDRLIVVVDLTSSHISFVASTTPNLTGNKAGTSFSTATVTGFASESRNYHTTLIETQAAPGGVIVPIGLLTPRMVI